MIMSSVLLNTNKKMESVEGLSSSSATTSIIELNVGGKHFSTTLQTLCSGAQLNYFSSLVASRVPSVRDDKNRYFIDRDPKLFACILNYLRSGRLVVPNAYSLNDVVEEAAFYCVDISKAPQLISTLANSAGNSSSHLAKEYGFIEYDWNSQWVRLYFPGVYFGTGGADTSAVLFRKAQDYVNQKITEGWTLDGWDCHKHPSPLTTWYFSRVKAANAATTNAPLHVNTPLAQQPILHAENASK